MAAMHIGMVQLRFSSCEMEYLSYMSIAERVSLELAVGQTQRRKVIRHSKKNGPLHSSEMHESQRTNWKQLTEAAAKQPQDYALQ